MATKITLTLDDELTEKECDDLRQLLADAFGEFATRRWPPDDYVESRYPSTNEGYSWLNRPEKIEQVMRRVVLAQKLHKAAFGHVVDPEPRADKRVVDSLRWLRETFGMSYEEARATFNQLEDKRVSKLMEGR
jgi:hypothetical protein